MRHLLPLSLRVRFLLATAAVVLVLSLSYGMVALVGYSVSFDKTTFRLLRGESNLFYTLAKWEDNRITVEMPENLNQQSPTLALIYNEKGKLLWAQRDIPWLVKSIRPDWLKTNGFHEIEADLNTTSSLIREDRSLQQKLNEIRAELKSQGYLKYYKQRDKRQKPADFLRFTSSDGFEILVGRNNAQNDKLTLHTARGKDLWFHVQKAPGSHVVVMSRGEDIPDTTKQEAAELAVVYSSTFKAGAAAKVAVDTTEVKNIWKANGAKPGMVLYEVYTTVYVTPREKLLDELKANAKK